MAYSEGGGNRSAVLDDLALLETLEQTTRPQFEKILELSGAPASVLPPETEPQTLRAIQLLRFMRSAGRLGELASAIERVCNGQRRRNPGGTSPRRRRKVVVVITLTIAATVLAFALTTSKFDGDPGRSRRGAPAPPAAPPNTSYASGQPHPANSPSTAAPARQLPTNAGGPATAFSACAGGKRTANRSGAPKPSAASAQHPGPDAMKEGRSADSAAKSSNALVTTTPSGETKIPSESPL